MSSFFIKHPTIAIVISIVMILLGGLALLGLPIEQYPNIVPPTIKMQATYPGANAETVANSVASPLEQSISGVVGMDYMTSTNANNGICSLSIVFEVGTDPNMDQTLAYMRYGQPPPSFRRKWPRWASPSPSPRAARWPCSTCTPRTTA